MQDQTETADRGLPWPDAYADALPAIERQWGIGRIYLSRQLSGGKSGALVYAADIESSDFTGQAILKLDSAADSAHQEEMESKLHGQAIADAPEFAAQHLPKLIKALHKGNQFALLSTIAGRGLEYAEPWPDCGHQEQLPAVRRLSRDLLDGWNADYRLPDGMHMPQQLLKSWLDYRLEPTEGGRIHDFLVQDCKLSPDEPSIAFEGHWYPNPLAFALGTLELPERLRLRAVTGHIHGDLHGLNLLVSPLKGEEPGYHIIDLADYRSRAFLFYDQAYFEAAYLLSSRVTASQEKWETLLKCLSRFGQDEGQRGLRTDDLGLIEMVSTMRHEVMDWIERHQGDRLSYMENQYFLARVAAGLSFCHKRVSEETRRMAFMYAASNLKDYIKLNKVDWPKHGPPFALEKGASCVAAPVEAAQKVVSLSVVSPVPQDGDPGVEVLMREPAPIRRKGIGGFIAELRSRRVLTVAGLYAIAAWLLVQAVSALQGAFGLPSWTDGAAAGLFILGFPLACYMSWRNAEGAGGSRTPADQRGHGIRDFLVVLCIAVIVALSIGRHALDDLTQSPPVEMVDTGGSIAVLPFRNLSPYGDDDTFSDGLTIEIMSALARTGQFRVTGQSSAFAYKNRSEDLRTIGEALGVENILEGSVRRFGNSVRIEAQLVHADDGFLVWSDVFEDQIQDIFLVQEQIANSIGTALERPLGLEAQSLQTDRTGNPHAYDLFVKGLPLLRQRGEAVSQAVSLFQDSVRIDPDFAAGWAALALAYDVLPSYVLEMDGRDVLPTSYYRRAQEAALKAEQLDPALPIVQHAVGNSLRRNRQWAQAEDRYRSALESDPSEHSVMEDYSELLATVGHHQQAIAMAEKVLDLDPLNPLYRYRVAELKWLAGQGVSQFEQLLDLYQTYPEFSQSAMRPIIGHLYREGEFDRLKRLIEDCMSCGTELRTRALELVEAAQTQPPEEVFDTYKGDPLLGYELLLSMGGPELVLESFRYDALTPSRPTLMFTVPWTVLEEVGKIDEFKFLVEEEGIAGYWQERGWPDRCAPVDDSFECS